MTKVPAKTLFVSYFTPSYREQAKRLTKSLDRLNLEHHVEAMEANDAMTWPDWCRRRSAFIGKCLADYAPDAVCWLDADCEVLRRPDVLMDLPTMRYDVAVWPRPSGVVGGVLWAAQSSAWFWSIVDGMTDRDEDARVNAALRYVREKKIPLRVYPLEPSYQYIPWLRRLEGPMPLKDVVILHYADETRRQAEKAKMGRRGRR